MTNLLKAFFIVCALVFTANVQASDLKSKVNNLNELKDLEVAVDALKQIFTTAEDKRQIDKKYQQLKGPSEKWIWRFEEINGKVGFRLNGKVQFTISDLSADGKSYKINNVPVKVKKGESFLSFHSNIVDILNKKITLESLFIQEAHAFLPLPLFIGLFASAVAVGEGEKYISSRPQLKCVREAKFNPNSHYRSMADSKKGADKYKSNRICSWVQKTPFYKRHRAVVQNFKPNGKFQKMHVTPYCAKHANNKAELLICNCRLRKMNSNCSIGWNMTEPMADATCRMGFETFMSCNTGVTYQSGKPSVPGHYVTPGATPKYHYKTPGAKPKNYKPVPAQPVHYETPDTNTYKVPSGNAEQPYSYSGNGRD